MLELTRAGECFVSLSVRVKRERQFGVQLSGRRKIKIMQDAGAICAMPAECYARDVAPQCPDLVPD